MGGKDEGDGEGRWTEGNGKSGKKTTRGIVKHRGIHGTVSISSDLSVITNLGVGANMSDLEQTSQVQSSTSDTS